MATGGAVFVQLAHPEEHGAAIRLAIIISQPGCKA